MPPRSIGSDQPKSRKIWPTDFFAGRGLGAGALARARVHAIQGPVGARRSAWAWAWAWAWAIMLLGCKAGPSDQSGSAATAPASPENVSKLTNFPPEAAPSAAEHVSKLTIDPAAPGMGGGSPPPPPSGPNAVPSSLSPVSEAALADAGAGSCRVVRGPIELPLRAPTSLSLRGDAVDVVLNEDGHPLIVSLAIGPLVLGAVPAGRESAQGERGKGLAVPCVAAGDRVFCPDRSGDVHRTTRGQADDRVVASSRPASRIAAGRLGGTRVALGYLASRQTSEGWVSEAWLAVDDEPPVRASEDGSGATAIALAPRGPDLVAVMVDARTALTAMHARAIGYDHRARLGEDAVVFVGGPGDRRTAAALAVPSTGQAWALLPIAKDVGSFGVAVVRIDDPPRVDEPVVWAMYPNGLDPAPIAVASGGGAATTWVARVRPQAATPFSPRVLDVGQVGPDGAIAVRQTVRTSGNPADIALAVDPFGALWLAWVDAEGSWIERLACADPPRRHP
jgi:hypothetical protein